MGAMMRPLPPPPPLDPLPPHPVADEAGQHARAADARVAVGRARDRVFGAGHGDEGQGDAGRAVDRHAATADGVPAGPVEAGDGQAIAAGPVPVGDVDDVGGVDGDLDAGRFAGRRAGRRDRDFVGRKRD